MDFATAAKKYDRLRTALPRYAKQVLRDAADDLGHNIGEQMRDAPDESEFRKRDDYGPVRIITSRLLLSWIGPDSENAVIRRPRRYALQSGEGASEHFRRVQQYKTITGLRTTVTVGSSVDYAQFIYEWAKYRGVPFLEPAAKKTLDQLRKRLVSGLYSQDGPRLTNFILSILRR